MQHLAGLLLFAAVGVSSLDVTIDTTALAAKTSDTFIGHGWEMWQMFNYLDRMSDPRFRAAASHLKGSVVRVGGITADWTRYVGFEKNSSVENVQPQPLAGDALVPRRGKGGVGFWPSAPSNFTRASFETLLEFLGAAGVSLIFDLNELLGRSCTHTVPGCTWNCGQWCEGAWDSSNARVFLQIRPQHADGV